jgi:hypothetical protein
MYVEWLSSRVEGAKVANYVGTYLNVRWTHGECRRITRYISFTSELPDIQLCEHLLHHSFQCSSCPPVNCENYTIYRNVASARPSNTLIAPVHSGELSSSSEDDQFPLSIIDVKLLSRELYCSDFGAYSSPIELVSGLLGAHTDIPIGYPQKNTFRLTRLFVSWRHPIKNWG